MRLPITPQISTKDGLSNKNARLTNCLKEVKKSGEEKAVIRPGLVLDAQASGVGGGLVVFNNQLVSVYGTTLGFGVDPPTEITSAFYNASGIQILSMVKLGSNYLCQSESQIYSTTDFVSFTPLLSDLYYLGALETNGTIAVCGMENDDTGDSGFLNISNSLVVTEVIETYAPSFTVWSGTKFFATKSATQTVTSADGVTWADGTATTSFTGQRIAYGNGIFLRVGVNAGLVYAQTSTDGALWSSAVQITGITATYGQYATTMNLIYAGDRFVFSGRDWVTTSTDGVTWASEYPYPENFDVVGLAYNSTLDAVITLGSYATYGIPQTKMISTDNGLTWIDTGEAVYNGIQYNGAYSSGATIIAFGSTVVSGAASNIEVISDGTAATIPALATIAAGPYDFAQSPI